MKLLRAKFENYRLLRDLELEFSCDNEKNLTVIRAANESGKTTMLTALQWALYGDDALPAKGVGYRFHPLDWKESDGDEATIVVTVEFELKKTKRKLDSFSEETSNYRIIRTVREKVDSSRSRDTSTAKLYEITDNGYTEIPTPDPWIRANLPLDLREVFFTDGDRALNFIETTDKSRTGQKLVENAIKSLLQLGVIEDAITHVKKTHSEINKQIKKQKSMQGLDDIISNLTSIGDEISLKEAELLDAKKQIGELDEAKKQIEENIAKALEKGDKFQLEKDYKSAKKIIENYESQLNELKIAHSNLFLSQKLAYELLGSALTPSIEKLDKLRDQGKIPNVTIPVLKDRLSSNVCICGESLESNEQGGRKRREHIENLIDESIKSDQIQELITGLYFSIHPILSTENSENWCYDYEKVHNKRESVSSLLEESRRKLKDLETQIESLGDTDIQNLNALKAEYEKNRDRFLQKKAELETKLEHLKSRFDELTQSRDKMVRQRQDGQKIAAQIDIVDDVLQILNGTYDQLTDEEMQKVSEQMNKIFLEMIGSDPAFDSNIRETEISNDYEIIVYGSNNRSLNPDRDLNGASRRALTLAFILALTQVSEVDAPNVIDTPLGMLSGFVKQSLLNVVARESKQLILFLTHSEIQGCEDIIDSIAGKVVTLTNSKHYPKMLENDSGVEEAKVLICHCDHRSDCIICKRIDFDDSNSE